MTPSVCQKTLVTYTYDSCMDSPPFGEKSSFLEIIIHWEVNPSWMLGVLWPGVGGNFHCYHPKLGNFVTKCYQFPLKSVTGTKCDTQIATPHPSCYKQKKGANSFSMV